MGEGRCYLLVLLAPGERFGAEGYGAAHEAFITRLIETDQILLGGRLDPPEPYWGGYLLACASPEAGRALAQQDPYISEGLAQPSYQVWDLVGINPRAIDPSRVLGPP